MEWIPEPEVEAWEYPRSVRFVLKISSVRYMFLTTSISPAFNVADISRYPIFNCTPQKIICMW